MTDLMPAAGLDPFYRMPTSFGPSLGPRNLPMDKRHLRYCRDATSLVVCARTEAEPLSRLLPAGFQLNMPARIEVGLAYYRNIGWLAGRAYNLLALRIPVLFQGRGGCVQGGFVPLMWENRADCLLTGRDELGVAKIYAEIPDLQSSGDGLCAEASWDGFRFFELTARAFTPAAPPATDGPMFFHKYIPRTGSLHEADVDCITVTGPDGGTVSIRSAQKGVARFSFFPARWEDMPTQYPIVNALAALPLLEFEGAWLIESSGGGDLMGQKVIT